MTPRNKIDKILYYYKLIQEYENEYKALNVRKTDFARQKNVPYRVFERMYFLIVYKQHNHPEFYQELKNHAAKYMASGLTPKEYAKDNQIKFTHLKEILAHEEAQTIIEENKEKLSFIKIPTHPHKPISAILPVANNEPSYLEIKVCEDILVRIKQSADDTKLFQLIKLLKDL